MLKLNRLVGTGSCPWSPQGLQRNILCNPSKEPLIEPWSLIASRVYIEHDGEKRHEPVGPNSAFLRGDKTNRYMRIISSSKCCVRFITVFQNVQSGEV